MADIIHLCSECGNRFPPEDLTVKRAIYFEMGTSGKKLKTRTVAWLCSNCLIDDEDWNLPRYRKGSFGFGIRGSDLEEAVAKGVVREDVAVEYLKEKEDEAPEPADTGTTASGERESSDEDEGDSLQDRRRVRASKIDKELGF